MAAAETAQPHPDPSCRAVPFDGFPHVVRTGRIEPAGRRQKGGDPTFVPTQTPRQEALHRKKRRSISRRSSVNGTFSDLRRGLMTIDHCGFSQSRCWRTASRMRRRMRLRTTAFPIARGRVKPIRGVSLSATRRQKAAKSGPGCRTPSSYTRRKSCGRRRRTRFGKPAMDYLSELTVSFFRPRARRRARTARPFFVSMRLRKPWVFARWRLFG